MKKQIYRRPIVVANWKMNKTPTDTKFFMHELKGRLPRNCRCDVVVCVPAICIPAAVNRRFALSHIFAGAQDCSAYHSGAYTGEIAADMLADAGCKYVIIGHSERRAMGDTDQIVNAKLHAALDAGLTPIVCVGEGTEQQESGTGEDWISVQIKSALHGITSKQIRKIILVYEPLLVDNDEDAAILKQAGDACNHIRNVIRKLFSGVIARTIPILYGGDIKEEFVKMVLMDPDIDGVLVGEKSLMPEPFAQIVQMANASADET